MTPEESSDRGAPGVENSVYYQVMETTCPQNHGRQNAIVDPETDSVIWVCVDCGTTMDSDHPDVEAI